MNVLLARLWNDQQCEMIASMIHKCAPLRGQVRGPVVKLFITDKFYVSSTYQVRYGRTFETL